MSYLKPPKTTQDHCVGYQSVVQAIDNNAALVTAFDARHSIGVGGNSPIGVPAQRLGRHDDMVIARSLAEFDVDTSFPTPILVPIILGPSFGQFVHTRLAVGQWQIFLGTPQLFAGVALMKSTTSSDRKATCYQVSSTTTGPSLIVSTWEIDAGAWAMADLSFSLVVWTQRP